MTPIAPQLLLFLKSLFLPQRFSAPDEEKFLRRAPLYRAVIGDIALAAAAGHRGIFALLVIAIIATIT